jgi:vacuolar protein sorting-associated protein 13A/C
LIDDFDDLHLPFLELVVDPIDFKMSNWSNQPMLDSQISLLANYYNERNSQWEPLIEKFKFLVKAHMETQDSRFMLEVISKQKLELNLSHVFMERLLAQSSKFSQEKKLQSVLRKTRAPYVIFNQTGYPIHVWTQISGSNLDKTISRIENDEKMEWRFDSWKTSREVFLT